ncbi:exonuclease 1 [Trichomycterus rosablanca]|uniref:exonuclease 1 n=1 Tax=Trichomycterus rosablanca TaxID=2290929 RepID=UPI002F35A577
MGIQGLLQFIKDAGEPVHVGKYRGQSVAVDTYCWLHKGAFSCAEKLAKGEPTDQYVSYCMKFVEMLLSYDIKPILVFDGRNLPSKQEVEKARRERRQANLQRGKRLLREGKLAEARECFTRCVNITPSMAHELVKAARARGVDCIVAPYEADAQLAFLNKTDVAQAVITEDSDLLAFGCKKVILKMDKQGNGLEVAQCHLGRCRSLGDVFTEEKFRYMCILSGCDYLASLYGIGLGKACKLLKIANNPDILKVIRKIGQYLKMNISVPDEYVEGFVKANNTFLYQLVFDPVRRKVVPLNPYPENIDPAALGYAGVNVGDKQGLQMALGNLDINTMDRIDNFNPDAPPAQPVKAPRSRGWGDGPAVSRSSHASIWSRDYVVGVAQRQTTSSPHRPTQTLGKLRVVPLRGLKLPHRETQVKRSHPDSGVSDEDVLEQYSSGPKRQRTEAPPVIPSESERPRARNRFATLLQRRNQSEESADDQGTRSRFFADSDPRVAGPKRAKPSEQEEPKDSDKSDHTDSSQPGEASPETRTTPRRPRPGVFGWSGGSGSGSSDHSGIRAGASERPRTPGLPSGLSALRHFQRKREGASWERGESPERSPVEPVADVETPPGSPPSQDSAYFSQNNSVAAGAEESPGGARSEEDDRWRDSGCSAAPGDAMVTEEIKPTPMRTKVSGLSRIRPGEQEKGARIGASAAARPSGLRKKPQGKKSGVTNENSSGLQATISGLWRNFSFNKENPKLNGCKKAEPMSPVKENVL